jgi:curved DNA-binding protein CbpA
MPNAFDRLGLQPTLALTDEALREAFRVAGKQSHPDAGGGEGEFSALNQAFATLSSPSSRLIEWLEWRGLAAETRGAIDPAVMDLFSEVGAVTQRSEALIRRRDEAKSALVRAMLEAETQQCREVLEAAIAKVEACIESACAVFPGLEQSTDPDAAFASMIARNLIFLEKWRAGLRSNFARLV